MKPLNIYSNKLKFHEENKFDLDCSQNSDATNSVLYSSKND